MPDTDYSEWTNERIDEAVARMMGWQKTKDGSHWLDSDGEDVCQPVSGIGSWKPTACAYDSARLLRHLWESGRFGNIVRETADTGDGGAWNFVRLFSDRQQEPVGLSMTGIADDPNGFRCLTIAALMAYEKEAGE